MTRGRTRYSGRMFSDFDNIVVVELFVTQQPRLPKSLPIYLPVYYCRSFTRFINIIIVSSCLFVVYEFSFIHCS